MHSAPERLGHGGRRALIAALNRERQGRLDGRGLRAVVVGALDHVKRSVRRQQHVAIGDLREERGRHDGEEQREDETFHNLRFTIDRRSIANSNDFR